MKDNNENTTHGNDAGNERPFDLLCSDLDGTLLGKPDATKAFRKTWLSIPPERRPILVYNSGRLLQDTLNELRTSSLPEADYLICGVGTVIYECAKKSTLKAFVEDLSVGWDIEKVEDIVSQVPDVEKQPSRYQHKFKSSWYLKDATPEQIDEIKGRLAEAGLKVHVIYSSARDLDVVPRWANKGNSLLWLLDHLNIPPGRVLVAGDTGNDSSMFRVKGVRGIIVENAQPELFQSTVSEPTYVAKEAFADGVLEGLREYGVIDKILYLEPGEQTDQKLDPEMGQLFKRRYLRALKEEEAQLIETAYKKALETVRKNITPLGFSACSIEDNTFENTEENYRSVWGRDGAITIVGTLGIEADDMRKCQRNTLTTLLRHISPTGQIPSSVRIEGDHPDYSGVGGISSIDSGLWIIIAFYHYIRATHDMDLLRESFDGLQGAMDWLSAHDSNNDALLEIPEAGDWMDLFGRSYNVLYDEVLWYRANLCFGRLAELLGDYEKASGYLRWTQSIKEAILRQFWPTSSEATRSFADIQYSVGEARYLLAEITPFGFDWRCDVYGNILAGLFNILDMERAQTVFRFLWAVGAHDPYPVRNLYPCVHAGDPDWRPYYTVNFLNLPHHYHNGGIWPFIGAQWVRFINRIGLRDVAQRELVRLSCANRQGVADDWEFNEWLHGQTGRPMGKKYQAWSAAGFIHACHELHLEPDNSGE